MSARAACARWAATVIACASATAAAQGAPRPGPSIEHQVVTQVGERRASADIERTVEQHIAGVRQCYAQRLRADANVRGHLTLRFFIAPSGAISQLVTPGGTMRDRAVIRCVLAMFARLRFARASGDGTTVIYGLDFAPHERFGA